jgi:AbrB family looped-hinge helix DNA binding protein
MLKEKSIVILMVVKFEATLVKWGNSVGFALPKPIRDGLELNAGDKIILVVDNDKIYIEKIK